MCLFTNDKAINRFKKNLQNEFFIETKKRINIIDGDKNQLYEVLKLENVVSKVDEKDESKHEEIFPESHKIESNIKERTIEIINNIFAELELSSNWNFITWKKMENDEIKKVLEELNQTISKYIFLDKIDINYIFDCQASNGKIKIHNLEELLNIYLEMSKEEKNALVYALACKFNS